MNNSTKRKERNNNIIALSIAIVLAIFTFILSDFLLKLLGISITLWPTLCYPLSGAVVGSCNFDRKISLLLPTLIISWTIVLYYIIILKIIFKKKILTRSKYK